MHYAEAKAKSGALAIKMAELADMKKSQTAGAKEA